LFILEDKGTVKSLPGVKIEYDREKGSFTLSQKAYIEAMFERFNLNEIDKQLVPMKKQDSLMFSKPAKWELEMLKAGEKIDDTRCDSTYYKSVVGSALHAIKWTRVDAMTAVFYEATAMHAPTNTALQVALKTLRYMWDTRDLKMHYNCADCEPNFTGYGDADLAGWHNGRSRTGWFVKFGGPDDKNAPICWYSKLQVPIYDNTPDAEQAALTELCHSIFWLRNLANDLGFKGMKPLYYKNHSMVSQADHADGKEEEVTANDDYILSKVYCDNEPTIKRCAKPGRWASKRKVHINNTKSVEYTNMDSPLRICELFHVPSALNIADIFTKIGVDTNNWLLLRMRLMNLPTKYG